MRNIKICAITGAVVVLTAAAPLWAAQKQDQTQSEQQQSQEWTPEAFAKMDTDKDGYISKDEIGDAVSEALFKDADTDGDGKLSKSEFVAAHTEQKGEQQADAKADQESTQIKVKEKQAQVNVKQAQPEVIVKQAQPEIIVKQPPPQVTVTQSKPEVTVESQKPEVKVEQAEAKVTVQEAEPKVDVQQTQAETTLAQSDTTGQQTEQLTTGQQDLGQQEQPLGTTDMASTQADQQHTSAVYNLTVDELEDRDVVNANGENLGEIEDIVYDQQSNDLMAVISVGGFLGIGDKDIVISLNELQLMDDDKLMLTTTRTEDQLKSEPAYDSSRYQKIEDDDVVVGNWTGGQAAPAIAQESDSLMNTDQNADQKFTDLDADQSGYLTRDEAEADATLNTVFEDLDTNSDGQLEKSEFAQFEMEQLRTQ